MRCRSNPRLPPPSQSTCATFLAFSCVVCAAGGERWNTDRAARVIPGARIRAQSQARTAAKLIRARGGSVLSEPQCHPHCAAGAAGAQDGPHGHGQRHGAAASDRGGIMRMPFTHLRSIRAVAASRAHRAVWRFAETRHCFMSLLENNNIDICILRNFLASGTLTAVESSAES
jgi:hypothetical protein